MPPVTSDPVPALSPEHLARLFGVDDLPARLAAVDDCIAGALRADGALLGEAAARVAGAGGKRLRPLFTIVAAQLGGVFDERVVKAAAAVELVQVGSLVHDDILDGADTRRGRATINAVEGVDHALLAGDYILARAAQLAASVSGEAAGLLATALGELCEGQVLEMRDVYDPDRSIESHLASVRGKTASLFSCACRLGAHCGGVSARNTEALARFGDSFGMGFQLLDDVLDIVGDGARLGKPTGNDIASGVYTLPLLSALAAPGGGELRHLLGNGSGARPEQVAEALDAVRRSGAVAGALTAADRYADEARRAVEHLNQTAVGDGLAAFPRVYATWALETLMDTRYLETPLTAPR
jgi:heptaprenyl diphosphate synthase